VGQKPTYCTPQEVTAECKVKKQAIEEKIHEGEEGEGVVSTDECK